MGYVYYKLTKMGMIKDGTMIATPYRFFLLKSICLPLWKGCNIPSPTVPTEAAPNFWLVRFPDVDQRRQVYEELNNMRMHIFVGMTSCQPAIRAK